MKNFIHFNIPTTLLLIVLITMSAFSGTIESETGTITGVILDDSSSAPVAFASVALMNAQDSSLLSGVITDDAGKFSFNNLPYGKYTVKATSVGYKTIQVRNIELTRQNKVVDLREMKMSENVQSISAAVIVGERLKGEEKIDRTVFTLNDDVRKASTTALDALKHIPSVTVDFQKNVTLEGQSNIQFYVDGVLRSKEYVDQIKPDIIDKIELITNPGVKYDADVSGVINIVLKKEARSGVSGSLKVPIPYPDKIVADCDGNLDYGNKKIRLYVGDQLHYETFPGKEITTTQIDDVNGSPYRFQKIAEGRNSWMNNYMNYGIDWFLNDKSSLNFMGEWRSWNGKSRNYKSLSTIYMGDDLTQYLKTVKKSEDGSDNYYFSLYYQRKFTGEGNDFKAEVYYNQQTGKTTGDYVDRYMDINDQSVELKKLYRSELTENLRQNGEIKLDLSFMIKNVRNEVGVRTYAAMMNNDFTTGSVMEGVDNTRLEEFDYDETRQTAFYNLSGKIKKFSWQAGIRGEYSSISINSNSNSDYAVFLPQLSLSQSLSKDQSLKFTYRKQISRPSIGSLNPFNTWTDSMHLRKGNPDLDPSIENRIELTYSKNFKTNYFSPKLYLRYTTNGIQENTEVNSEGISLITQENIGRNMEYGLGLNGAFQLFKRWRMNANLSVYQQIIKTDKEVAGHSQEDIVSYRFNVSNIISLPKDYSVFMFANYGSPNISYQRKNSRQLLMLVGAEKKFNDKFSADVFYNPFIKDFMYRRVETHTPGYVETWKGIIDVQQLFCFSVTYNFNRGNKISKINRSVEYERNEGKGGL
jgi:ferric enterobactin receptor